MTSNKRWMTVNIAAHYTLSLPPHHNHPHKKQTLRGRVCSRLVTVLLCTHLNNLCWCRFLPLPVDCRPCRHCCSVRPAKPGQDGHKQTKASNIKPPTIKPPTHVAVAAASHTTDVVFMPGTHQHVQPNVVSNCLSQHYLTEIVVVFPEAVKMAIIWPVLCPLHTTTARIHAEVSRHTKISEQPTANESKTRPHKSSSCEVRPRLYAL